MVVPFALVFAAHPAPHVPHHPAPYHDPYHPAPHGYCDPKAPPACALDSDLPYCVVDPEYPEYEVANKISQDPIFLKKYSDVADQSADDLVEAITAFQEASFNYDYYTGASKVSFFYTSDQKFGLGTNLILFGLATAKNRSHKNVLKN